MNCLHRYSAAVGLGLTLVLSAAAFSTAQDRGAGLETETPGRSESLAGLVRSVGSGPQTPITILMAPAVQKELKLTETQKGKVFNLSVAATEKLRDLFQSLFMGGAGAQGGINPQELQSSREAIRRDTEQAISRILEESQKERFNQIVLRAEGPLAVARPEVASKLRLNNTQRQYVQSIVTQMQQTQFLMLARMRQGAATGQGPVNAGQVAQLREMMAKVRDGAVQQLSKVIDAKQKAAFNAMLGDPFDFEKTDDGAGTTPAEDAAAATPAKSAPAPAADKASDEAVTSPEKAAKAAGRTSRKKSRTRSKSSQ